LTVMIITLVHTITVIRKQGVGIPLLRDLDLVMMVIVILILVGLLPLSLVMITTTVLKTGAILLLKNLVNILKYVVMIMMPVLKTVVFPLLVVLIHPLPVTQKMLAIPPIVILN